jgi:hypothetical protein
MYMYISANEANRTAKLLLLLIDQVVPSDARIMQIAVVNETRC